MPGQRARSSRSPAPTAAGVGVCKRKRPSRSRCRRGSTRATASGSRGEGERGEHGGAPGRPLCPGPGRRSIPIFTREDNNLYCEVPIGFVMAALGGEMEVPTLDGKVSLKIPAGTQTGKMFRVRGKGVKPVRERRRRRPDLPGHGRDAGQPHRAPEGAVAGVRCERPGGRLAAQSPGVDLGRRGQELLREDGLLNRFCAWGERRLRP